MTIGSEVKCIVCGKKAHIKTVDQLVAIAFGAKVKCKKCCEQIKFNLEKER